MFVWVASFLFHVSEFSFISVKYMRGNTKSLTNTDSYTHINTLATFGIDACVSCMTICSER